MVEALDRSFATSLPESIKFFGLPHGDLEIVPITLQATEILQKFQHAHCERIAANVSKPFDLVFVANDRSVKNSMFKRISMVHRREFDHIRQWLLQIGLGVTFGPTSLNWPNTIKSYDEDREFYYGADGYGNPNKSGWSFLQIGRQEQAHPSLRGDIGKSKSHL